MSIQILLNLDEEQAWALAQFLKRAGYSDYRPLAANEQEAQDMQAAADRLRMSLAEQGIAPR
ncbi:hypothetical protein UNDKW_4014 [Undibacterium sp. KW1]|uniref:DUF7706 family protein n=1 Tax=Undibacterium sp. KW1 TaxID=2058624 RepID=UPI001331D414|nr:hypothetical protein [Undibacterium sp. KW1]BBB62269.1 hypothetical protein UNDKW_3996 [Undibacterium sp. KW1]BBB62287.1 hypothetical protein UNDKW_4014 [Undibacterium sp. KW1]